MMLLCTRTKKPLSKTSESLLSSSDLDVNLSSPKIFQACTLPVTMRILDFNICSEPYFKYVSIGRATAFLLAFCCCFKHKHLLQGTGFSRHSPLFQSRVAEDPDHVLGVTVICNSRAGRFQALLGRRRQ